MSIDEFTAIFDKRLRPGDGEMDLIIERMGDSVLITWGERKKRCTLIFLPKLRSLKSEGPYRRLKSPFVTLVKTQTFDNGKKFTLNETITQALMTNSRV